MNKICQYCKSSNVEKRGTREKKGEVYLRLKCRACNKWSQVLITYEKIPNFERSEEEINNLLDSNIFIITCAQNNTPLDKKAWEGIQKYSEFRKAQVIVIPILYRNPTCPEELYSKEAWWPPEVIPYLVEQDIKIGPSIRVIGDAKINATNANPVGGFESLTGGDSAIFGHAQIQMRTIATPQNKLPKILHTTGSVSQKNYSKSKAGKKGDFHHSLGFVIVEIDREEEIFHLRGVVGDHTSEFYDLNYHITNRGVKQINQIEAIVLGDEHERFGCPDTKKATFEGPSSIVQTLKPKWIVRHDVIDSYSISHHHKHSPATLLKKQLRQQNKLEDELKDTALYLEETTPDFTTSVIVPSNHHNHIKRWLEEVDWKSELWNARIYHEMWSAWITAIEQGKEDSWHPFTWWMQKNCKANALYLQEDYPFIVQGIYLGYHGDRGPNGSRGNIKSFAKIGVKTVTGHPHQPGIEKGAYQVGTSSKLRLDYNPGPSSWLNTHCIVHANGKRQLINIIYGDWRFENNGK